MTLGVPKVEIYAVSTVTGAGWHDITARVRPSADGKTAIKIQHGNHGTAGGIPEPSQCWMTWDCRDGSLWPGNPMSEFSGSLGLNTPLRVPLEMVRHTFPGTVVNGWSAIGGFTVVNTGLGGTVAASDWQQSGGTATHSVPVASAYRQSVVDSWDMEDIEQTIEFQLPTSDVAGGAVEPANLIFRYVDGVSHYLLRVSVNPDETITMKWIHIEIGIGEFDETSVYTAPITNTGQWIKVKASIENNRLQAKAWDPDDLEPLEWVINEAPSSNGLLVRPGDIGVRTGIASGNTNTKPVVVSYRNWTIRSIRFFGEVSEYPLEIETSGNDLTVHVVASGTTRRLTQGALPALSSLRRAIPQQPGVQAYWPLEDTRGATSFGSALSGHPPMIPLTGTPGYAEYSDLPSSQSLPTGNGSDWRGVVPDYDNTGDLQVSFVLHLPSGDQVDRAILCRWYTDHPLAKLWQLIYRSGGGDLQLQAWNSESAFVYESSVAGFTLNDSVSLVSVQLSNNGSDVDWEIRALDIINGGTGLSTGTATGLQLASVKSVWMNLQLLDTPAFGHVTVQSVLSDYFALSDEVRAWNGELSEGLRMARLLEENGYECTRDRDAFANTFRMGPQEPADLQTLLEECVTLDSGGVWFDGRSHAGIMYRHRTALYNQDPWVTLSYADRHLSPPWAPRIDPRDIANKITVSRKGGSSATFELESGPKSTLPPGQGGVGTYPGGNVTVNAYDDTMLLQMAAWRVAIGTVDEPRYTAAATNVALASTEIGRRLLDIRRGRVFEVADAAAVFRFDSAFQLVDGYTEEITDFVHTFELNGVPANPYTVFELEHDERGQVDSGGSTLAAAINSTVTEFEVDSPTDVWTTNPADFPLKLTLGGEVVVCNDITGTVPAYIATGTAAHADNASVSPGIPGGATAAGDDMLMITQGRGSRQANVPTGWAHVIAFGGIRLFRKTHSGSESAPTVSWSTGSAGDTNSSVITSWSDLGDLIASATASGGGVQNIGIAEVTGPIADGVVITVGVKADDWTSVATRTGATEIVDVSTTVGNDQGIIADYVLHNGSVTGLPSVTRPPSEFVVTGGATSGYGSLALIFGNRQVFDVTRSDNGVVKSHAAGTEVHIFNDLRWSL